VENRTPREAFWVFTVQTKNQALNVQGSGEALLVASGVASAKPKNVRMNRSSLFFLPLVSFRSFRPFVPFAFRQPFRKIDGT
jgi:hypothetical protein